MQQASLSKPILLALALALAVVPASTGVQGSPGRAHVQENDASAPATFEGRRAVHPGRAIAEMQSVATALRLGSRWSSNAPVRFAARHIDFRSP